VKRLVSALAVCLALAGLAPIGARENVFAIGSFDKIDAKRNFPVGWGAARPSKTEVRSEDGNRFVRLTNDDPRAVVNIHGVIKLRSEWKALKISARMKAVGLKVGQAGWHNARVVVRFEDARGELVRYSPSPSLRKDSDWTTVTVTVPVPEKAAHVLFQPGLYFATGVMEIDDIRVEPLAAMPVAKPAAQPKTGGEVFPQGRFERLNSRGDFADGWHGVDHKRVRLEKKDGNQWVSITNEDPTKVVSVLASLPLEPDWYAVKISVRMKAANLKLGEEGWHNARLVMRFEDGKGKMVGGYPGQPSLKADSGWTKLVVTNDVPKGAKVLKMQPGLYFATGRMEIDDILVTPLNAKTLIDAKLPEGEKLYWCQEPVEELTATRARRVLNGIWKFVPAIGPAEKAPEKGWGYIRTPGGWYARRWATGKVIAQGVGMCWRGVNFIELAQGWYERDILVPEAWKGREIILAIGQVCTDAIIYVDSKKAGVVQWPSGEVVLTPFVTPGKKAKLRILVLAVGSDKEVKQFLDADTAITRQAALQARGITGDVWLAARPLDARIDGVFVKTSVRKKELGIQIELKGVKASGEVKFTAVVRDAGGAEAHRFGAATSVKAIDEQAVEISSKWADPKLWDFRRPNLYTLYLKAEGPGMSDEVRQRFGFREFRIEGKKFLLNERICNLRPALCFREKQCGGLREAIGGIIDGFIHANFNMTELWPWDHDERGAAHYRELWADVADEKGWLLMYPALSMGAYISTWGEPGKKEHWERRMVAEWKRYRNHPSIVIHVSTANRFGHGDDQNPLRLGNAKNIMGNQKWLKRAKSGLEAMEIIRRHDPTRPITSHHASGVGDIHTCNNYLNMIPLQEREEWLSAWAASGDKPYMGIEFGTPFSYTMLRGRDGCHHAPHSELLATEFCASYLGGESYRLETKEYKQAIAGRFRKGQDYGRWQGSRWLLYEPPHQQLQRLFIRNTWRSWRTWGHSGGMIPWEQGAGWKGVSGRGPIKMPPFKPGRLGAYLNEIAPDYILGMNAGGREITDSGKALMAANSPTVAWIAGPGKAFTAKDHNFYSGSVVSKGAVLLNDEREGLDYELAWTVHVGSAKAASGRKSGRIGVGGIVMVPIEFKAPIVRSKTDGKIALTARIGKAAHQDTFGFRVFPKLANGFRAEALIFDPTGDTRKLLEGVGCETRPWDGRPAPGKALVIGRNGLADPAKLPGSLEAFVKAGGRAVVFGQDPQWMRKRARLRVAHLVSRRFFPVPSQTDHAILKGLDEMDLRDWRGSGSLVPERMNCDLDDYGRRPYGWHWTNRGSVSSAPIEKPHRTGWRPIIEGEFDLAFTPLMELAYGKGLLVWCSLDLEGRNVADPVAELLARRIIDYATSATPVARAPKVVYVSRLASASIVTMLGLKCVVSKALPADAALAVFAADAEIDDAALNAFLKAGGKALFLPRPAGRLPLGLRAEEKDFDGSLDVPDWPECRGLSSSDLRLRAFVRAPLIVSGPARIGAGGLLARLRVGRGTAIFVQLTPDMLDYKKKTYLRYSGWRLTRTIAQLLANMGGEFVMDKRSFDFAGRIRSPFDPVVLNGLWKAKKEVGLPPAPSPNKPVSDPGNKGFAMGWASPDHSTSNWIDIELPGYIEERVDAWSELDGAFWFRKEIDVPAQWKGRDLVLQLGAVDDHDVTYLNGEKIGATGEETPSFWSYRRAYKIPARLVRPGRNVLAVRVFDRFGSGGFNAQANEMVVRLVDGPILPGNYCPGYRLDHARGDDPYRYHRW